MNAVVDLTLYSKRAGRRSSEIVPISYTIKHTKGEHYIPGKRSARPSSGPDVQTKPSAYWTVLEVRNEIQSGIEKDWSRKHSHDNTTLKDHGSVDYSNVSVDLAQGRALSHSL